MNQTSRQTTIEAQLRRYYQTRSQADMADEEQWAALAQQQLEKTVALEGL